MKISEWQAENQAIDADITVTPMRDVVISISQNNIKVSRTLPMMQLPWAEDEVVLEDYICTIFESLKHKLEAEMNALSIEDTSKLFDHYIQNVPNDISDEEFANVVEEITNKKLDQVKKED